MTAMGTLFTFLIFATSSLATSQSQSSCLVQTRFDSSKGATDGVGSDDDQKDADVESVSGFSTEQQQCIASYVAEVQALLPRYHLQSRRFGGISKASTKAKAAPVLGAGFGSTATRSLAVFGRQLGLKVHHFDPLDSPKWSDLDLRLNTSCSERHQLNQVNFSELLHETGSDVFLDTPMAELFLDFFAASPSSKVILTLRDSKQWALRRLKNFADAPVPVQSSCGHRLDSLSVEAAAQLFESHQKLVRCVVPPKQLLEVNVFDGALNSTKIARFLGVKPDFYVPFPRVASDAEDLADLLPNNVSSAEDAFVKGDRLPICITGQIRRLELRTKLKRFIEPMLSAGHRVEVYLVIDPRKDTNYIHRAAGSHTGGGQYTILTGEFESLNETLELFPKNMTVIFDPFVPADYRFDPRYAMMMEQISAWGKSLGTALWRAMQRARSHGRQWEALRRCWRLAQIADPVPPKAAIRLRDDVAVLQRFVPSLETMSRGVHVQNCEHYFGLNDKGAIVAGQGQVENYFTKPLELMLKNFTQLLSFQKSRCTRPLNPESVLFNSMVLSNVQPHYLKNFPIRPGINLQDENQTVNLCYSQGAHNTECFEDRDLLENMKGGIKIYKTSTTPQELLYICEPPEK